MKFCDKLANLRKAKNLSQEQLAEKLAVSRQTISKWESGDTYPDMSKILQLTKVLDCTLPDIMDDGSFGEEFSKKEKKSNTINDYFNSFLNYVTKCYNMFLNMTFKSKVICILEMSILALIIIGLTTLVYSILDSFIIRIFKDFALEKILVDHFPDIFTSHNYIYSFLCTIVQIILIFIGVIVFLHIFKIRYLDYYVTISDNTVSTQTVEQPIAENKNQTALMVKKTNEPKMVIRDPKHTFPSFFKGVLGILNIVFKILLICCILPILFIFVFLAVMAALTLVNVVYSSIFFYGFICILGLLLLCFVIIYVVFNYIFNQKQFYTLSIILFVSSLLLSGIGFGLASNKILKLDVVSASNKLTYSEKQFKINEDEVVDGLSLYFDVAYDNIKVVVDNNVKGIDITIKENEFANFEMEHEKWYGEDNKVSRINFCSYQDNSLLKLYNFTINDIKNGCIREDYNFYFYNYVEIRLSEDTLKKIKIN